MAKNFADGARELDEGAVTVNAKTTSSRTFHQVVHTGFGHKFFAFFVASA
jgi:hypothetical protein